MQKNLGWSTREVAELAGTTLKTVRHYHDIGLLEEPVAGMLMAAAPLGTLAGVTVFARYVSSRARLTLLGPLAILTSVPLVFAAFEPGVAGSVVLWTLIGVFSAYQVTANAEFVRAVPDHRRRQAVGLAGSGVIPAQGLGIAAGGLLAELSDPATAIAIVGVAGILAAVPIAVAWRTMTR
ncbi:putative MFS family arabinose efflux permease [Nonomuraea angiospora]|uniref:MFS family arabinose efflux permease n=1 Tax=Nonomuraea angiospora TaxID=46172 RepID=A0ABR9MHN9_9ACTN|nr:putative MFS family arabinose efflux permease [Nonomuraea angiospora]